MTKQQNQSQKTIKLLLIDINAWKLKFLNLLIPIAQESGIMLKITATNQLFGENFKNFDVLLISEEISCNDSKNFKQVIADNEYIIGISESNNSHGFFKRFKIEEFINVREYSSLKTWKKIKRLLKI